LFADCRILMIDLSVLCWRRTEAPWRDSSDWIRGFPKLLL